MTDSRDASDRHTEAAYVDNQADRTYPEQDRAARPTAVVVIERAIWALKAISMCLDCYRHGVCGKHDAQADAALALDPPRAAQHLAEAVKALAKIAGEWCVLPPCSACKHHVETARATLAAIRGGGS